MSSFCHCVFNLLSSSVSAAHTVSEDGQNDPYTESISSLHSSSPSSSPAARHHHGNSPRALSSSQVANRKWVCGSSCNADSCANKASFMSPCRDSWIECLIFIWKMKIIFPEIDLYYIYTILIFPESFPCSIKSHIKSKAKPFLLCLSSNPFMYFITESAAIECGCILGGIVSYMVWCCMTIFKECVCVYLHWHLHRQSEGHLAIWSLEYFHSAALEWSHFLDRTHVWRWICVWWKNKTCTKCKRDFQLDCFMWC